MIRIEEVKTKRQIKEFINFPLKLYKNNPYYIPMLYMDEKAMFKKDYYYLEQSEHRCFNAYDENGVMVGRIQGILQFAANKKWKQQRVRFNRFDSIDSQEVADALFKAVEDYAKEKGMEEVVGPLGFSDQEREGLLIEGFDQYQTYEEQYNYPYYQKLIENIGYVKEVDWVERRLTLKDNKVDERLERISDKMMDRLGLHIAKVKNINDLIKRYANQIFDMIDITYNDIYGSVPFTETQKKGLLDTFRLVLDTDHIAVIVDENDKVVCFAITFPSFGPALQKSGGRLTPITIIKLLHLLKHSKGMDLGLIGVAPEYLNKGVATAFFVELMRRMVATKVEWAETLLNLEDNIAIQNQWKNFNGEINKRRRSFVKSIK